MPGSGVELLKKTDESSAVSVRRNLDLLELRDISSLKVLRDIERYSNLSQGAM